MRGIYKATSQKLNASLASVATGLYALGFGLPGFAQVTSDGTTSTVVNQSGNLIEILNGRQVGNNLFHSFRDFSVSQGIEARFNLNNTSNIATIFSRVTGGNVSHIDGTISIVGNPSASLFLLNPAGIIFGQNAKLQIGGSFVGTTASSIKFADGTEFSAVNPGSTPLLTMSVPIGLQMGSSASPITVQARPLQVGTGQSLVLLGGDIDLNGTGSARIIATDGQVILGSVAAENFVPFSFSNARFNFDFSGIPTFQTVQLRNGFTVDVNGSRGGNIQIQGRQVNITGNSQLMANSTGNTADGEGVVVRASDALNVVDSEIRVRLTADATQGRGGNITLGAPVMQITGNSNIATNLRGKETFGTLGLDKGSNITITAQDFLLLGNPTSRTGTGTARITTQGQGGVGRVGDIRITADRVRLLNNARVITDVTSTPVGGKAQAGDVIVNAGDVEISGSSSSQINSWISSTLERNTSGWGGNIEINASRSVRLSDSGTIRADSFGNGNASNITIRTPDLEIVGTNGVSRQSRISSSTAIYAAAPGFNAGDIRIETQRLRVLDGGSLLVSSETKSSSGSINIKATESVEVIGAVLDDTGGWRISGIDASSRGEPLPNGDPSHIARIKITTDTLRVLNSGAIKSSVTGDRIGGDITINANTIEVGGRAVQIETMPTSQISSAASNPLTPTAGIAGNISLMTNQLLVRDGGSISVSGNDQAQAGNLQITAAQSINLTQNSSLSATSSAVDAGNINLSNTSGAGTTGNINITTDRFSILNGSSINSSTSGSGKAGAIKLNVANTFELDNSTLLASTSGSGKGGEIAITTGKLQLNNQSLLSSNTTGMGDAGVIDVKSDVISLNHSTISSQSSNTGESGSVKLNTTTLDLRDNAIISTAASQSGNAGNLNITASDRIHLKNGSQITSRNTGTGNGGTVEMTARELFLHQNSQINASTVLSDGGNLILNIAEIFRLSDRSLLNTEAGETGNGGNIHLNAQFVIGAGNSDIIANAVRGRGGNINITTKSILGLEFRQQLTAGNDITASSEFGVNGTVQITTPGVDANSGLVELPVNLVDSSKQIATGCANINDSSFVATGRGGMPQNPTQEVMSDRTWSDTRDISSFRQVGEVVAQIPPSPKELIPATSWYRNNQGKIELVADKSPEYGSLSFSCPDVAKY